MATQNLSHQGTLRGSVTLPIDSTSDGEAGYKTALSEVDSDAGSEAGHDPENYSPDRTPQSQSAGRGEVIEVEELPDDYSAEQGHTTARKTPKDSPAYVAPIGKMPKIPSVEPISSNSHHPTAGDSSDPKPKKQPIYEISKDHLVGKKINEFGDIINSDGVVLGSVEGDLPSMVGRSISNARGDVLGDDGKLLGYVAEVETGEGQEKSSEEQAPTWSMAEVMQAMAAAGKGPGGLRVDPFGNILDADGNTVGSFHDNISGFGKKHHTKSGGGGGGANKPKTRSKSPRQEDSKTSNESSAQPPQQRENAQSHRKEDPALSPSDIFLDVKSTTEGIQLTIRIPTVFNSGGQPSQPKVVFS